MLPRSDHQCAANAMTASADGCTVLCHTWATIPGRDTRTELPDNLLMMSVRCDVEALGSRSLQNMPALRVRDSLSYHEQMLVVLNVTCQKC
eukprot:9469191-Pyramimonas_sp.AAC.1